MKKLICFFIKSLFFDKMVLLMLFFIILGCIPIITTYWEPSAHDGKLLNSAKGTVGYKDMIEFSFNGVNIQLTSGGSWLVLNLLVPEGKSVAFLSDVIEINENKSSRMIRFKMSDWDKKTLKEFEISPLQVMYGENTSVATFGGNLPKTYAGVGHFKFTDTPIINYSVKLPLLKVGDQIFDIPMVSFTRKDGYGIGPIN